MVTQEDMIQVLVIWAVIMVDKEDEVSQVEEITLLDLRLGTTHHHLGTTHRQGEAVAIHQVETCHHLQETTLLWIHVMVNILPDQCMVLAETTLLVAETTPHLDETTLLQAGTMHHLVGTIHHQAGTIHHQGTIPAAVVVTI